MAYEVNFTVLCPTCKREVDQGTFEPEALREFLADETLRFFCPRCHAEWRPDEQERKSVQQLLLLGSVTMA
jgi:uncharacterized Zn ribbon protein